MGKLYKYAFYIVFTMLFLVACIGKGDRKTTPWGTPVSEVEEQASVDVLPQSGVAGLDDIIENGELIVLTLTGPDTYYDYRGHGLGVQYMMCEAFAATLGLITRVEVCSDTLDLVSKLKEGYGDVIAVQLPKDKYKDKGLLYCGAFGRVARGEEQEAKVESGERSVETQWAVNVQNKELADSLNSWFRADMTKKMADREDYLLAQAVVHSSAWLSASASALKVSRSTYNALFQRYAPAAGISWQLMARQCQQESGFDPGARSWAGACGLMQIMPSTAARFGLSKEDIFDPEKNIATSARIMGSLMRDFSDVPNPFERTCFAMAAYNAGLGHIRDAMALAREDGAPTTSWTSVSRYVLRLMQPQYYQSPVVHHGYMRGTETVGYVAKIMGR